MGFKAGMIQFLKLIKDEKEISYFTNRHKNKLNNHLLKGFETRSTKKKHEIDSKHLDKRHVDNIRNRLGHIHAKEKD